MDASYVRRLLPRLAARAGIDKRVHPHPTACATPTPTSSPPKASLPTSSNNSSDTAPSPPPTATYATSPPSNESPPCKPANGRPSYFAALENVGAQGAHEELKDAVE